MNSRQSMMMTGHTNKPSGLQTFRPAVIGLIAGMLGALAMDQFTRVWNTAVSDTRRTKQSLPYGQQEWDSTSRTAARLGRWLFKRSLTTTEIRTGAQIVHFGVGGLAGAAYNVWRGGSATTLRSGVLFGAILWVVGEELAMPLLGINNPPGAYTARMHAHSLGEHLCYGAGTALASRFLAAIL